MKNKQLSHNIILSIFIIIITYIINKFIFFTSTLKDMLYNNNGHYFKWRFGNIYYIKQGKGDPIFLIHDLQSYSSSYEWNLLIRELSVNHTVYSLDLLGCGKSDKPNITYTNYIYVQLINDFINNIIKQKTDIIATGLSSSIIIMNSFINPQLINKILLINPQHFSDMKMIPDYKLKVYKRLLELPLFGTLIYNIALSKKNIKLNHENINFYNSSNLSRRIIDAYYESAHLKGSSSKYLYASIKSNFTNINIIRPLKNLNKNIHVIIGEDETNGIKTAKEYISHNNSIKYTIIKKTKHLPQLENSNAVLKVVNNYFN